MCLYTKKTNKDTKEWLKTKPEQITAYKVVKKHGDSYYSIFFGQDPYIDKNFLQHKPEEITYCEKTNREVFYIAGFHLFLSRNSAVAYAYPSDVILKCKVPKKNILAVGKDGKNYKSTTLVTSCFEIIEEVPRVYC